VRTFQGRAAELTLLIDCWRAVITRRSCPHFVLLLADSGYGKTRLVHEFYHRISLDERAADADGYWPEFLTDDFTGLQINPGVCNPAKELPWMWWGMRWPQDFKSGPIFRNEAVANGLAAS